MPVKRKRPKTKKYRLQSYIKPEQKLLIDRALEILGHGTISGFAARVVLAEARRVLEQNGESAQPPIKPKATVPR